MTQDRHKVSLVRLPMQTCGQGYPNTPKFIGWYNMAHSHEVGDENLKFTRVPKVMRHQIAKWLCEGINHKQIVCQL